MGVQAAKKALQAAQLNAESIDLIIVATTTAAYCFPSAACLIQKELGVPGCPAFDISAACAGFNYALSLADQAIRSGAAKTVLVVGSEIMSRLVDWQDRRTCVLFADGAGAVLLQASETPGILASHIAADGGYDELLYVPQLTLQQYQAGAEGHIKMRGNELFKIAVTKLGDAVVNMLAKQNLTQDDIDWFVPHQANIRIIQAVAKRLGLTMDKVVVTLTKQGNTSAASVPLALDTAIRAGSIQRGQKILLESFGGGLTWGAALIHY
jgi:3-oxoacyl-[acyl-carrier-protein] synthase-3